MRLTRLAPSVVLGLISVLLGLVLWAGVVHSGLISSRVVPSPLDLVRALLTLLRDGYVGIPFYHHIAASLARTLAGFTLAVICGVPLGLVAGRVMWLDSLLFPWFAFLRPIPAIAFVPLVILWFGIGEFSKISVIFFTSFLYITVNTIVAVKGIPQQLLRAGDSLGANNRKLFMYVIFPAALPQIMAGIRIGSAISWTLVVAAELVAAQAGLGYMIMDAATFFRVPDVYIGLITIGIVGFLLESAIALIERRVVHWHGK
jgi:ABC-type nitrate/sulfonate/bicarbonate transport system permease component